MSTDTKIAASPSALSELVAHILAMENDAYLTGHPEWEQIVAEAKAASFTETDVVAWIAARTKALKASLGRYTTLDLRFSVWSDDRAEHEWSINTGAWEKIHSGRTIDEAVRSGVGENPLEIAAQKRAKAAELIAKAELLERQAQEVSA